MVIERVSGCKHLKLKSGESLTDEYRKKLLKREMVWSFYATDYHYYKILK